MVSAAFPAVVAAPFDARREGWRSPGKYTQGQSIRDPASQWYHEMLSNDELLDSINNADEGEGIVASQEGFGHVRQVESGQGTSAFSATRRRPASSWRTAER